MEARATGKFLRLSPRKVRLIAQELSGKPVQDVLQSLRFVKTPAGRALAKAVQSAASNAENNFQMLPRELVVKTALIDKGPRLKRFRARSRGRASPLRKPTSHITVIVSDI
jgi:large subunit ribosomal protein L22